MFVCVSSRAGGRAWGGTQVREYRVDEHPCVRTLLHGGRCSMGSIFGSKPSDAHVVWQTGADRKRFDFEYLELWAAHFGFGFERWERVDHERGEEPRQQHVCVFARTAGSGTELSLGDETWTMDAEEKPRTFIEIDEAGMVRLRGWTTEATLDVTELVVDGPTLKLRTADGRTKSVDAHRLSSTPEE